MSRSIPAGGQITPFDWASLSLSGPELPPPTVGGSPLTSGGHVTPCSGDVFSVGCASTTCLCEANERCNDHNGQAQKATPHTLTERVGQRPEAQYVPAAYRRRERPGI